MNEQRKYLSVGMGSAFALFLISLIAPLYIVLGGENASVVLFSRIPGMDLRFDAFDRISIISFFVILTAFFVCHALYEQSTLRRVFSVMAAIYCTAYLTILVLVGINGLVINNFPVIAIPLWIVVGSKLLIMFPVVYFLLIALDKRISPFVRTSAFFHSVSLSLILVIKIFEIYMSVSARAMVFDVSISLYFITLAMVTFFMYRKYYSDDAE